MITLLMKILNWCSVSAIFICFSYQFFLFLSAYVKKKKETKENSAYRKYAVLISARNEEKVIGNLIRSIRKQDYPKELIDIYVLADNCTDATARVAKRCGAVCYERFNTEYVGKGYALDYLLKKMQAEDKLEQYDGYYIFDADNLLDKSYIREMNKVFNEGYQVVTSYRNSINSDENWISAGYAIWFLHESQFLNRGRMQLGSSCMVSGTGYMISGEIIRKMGGWPFHLLTEDIEFTGECILNGIRIGYCEDAVFYDEQPVTMKDSWNQRLRWVKGYFQVYKKCGRGLVHRFFRQKEETDKFSCWDMLMTNLPAFIIIVFQALSMAACFILGKALGLDTSFVPISALRFVGGTCAGMFALAVFTMYTERKQLNLSWKKKCIAAITFPVFMWTYCVIAVVAIGKKVEWKQIAHRGEEKEGKIVQDSRFCRPIPYAERKLAK